MITQIGMTTDDKCVMSGVYRFAETYGLPLDMIFTIMQERNQMPSWVSFYKEAKSAGMKHRRIIAKLSEPMREVFGADFTTHVLGRLETYGSIA